MSGPFGLAGRKAIVTGAGLGIGRSIALRLAREGCDIGILDRDEAAATATAEMVGAEGRKAAVAIASVAARGEVESAAATLIERLGAVDILVNNAGILRTSPFLETSASDWRDVLGINLDGVFHVSQAVVPGMVARGRGAVINMSSWTGKQGVPNHSAYSASKFAVIGLTQSMAGELAAHGIRVNAVCPGIIVDTRMREEAETLNRAQGMPEVETRARAIPMRRPGYPDEIANVVAFLASDQAGYVTGEAVNITGGLWMS